MHRIGVRHDEVDASAGGEHFEGPGAPGDSKNRIGACAPEPAAGLVRNYERDEPGVIARMTENGPMGRRASDAGSHVRGARRINPETAVHACFHVGKQMAMILPAAGADASTCFNREHMTVETVRHQLGIDDAGCAAMFDSSFG